MDSEAARLKNASGSIDDPGPESTPAPSDSERRIEELMRVNAGLAAEVQALATGLVEAPRGSAMTTSRRVGSLIDERDTLAEHLEETRVGLAATQESLEELHRHNQQLTAEIARLRSGYLGALRRARVRFLRR